VQIIDISNPAAIVAKDAETDEENEFTKLKGARDVDIFTIGSSTYAIVAGYSDNGVQIIDISNPAAIVAKGTATDGATFTMLKGASGVDTFTIGSSTYAIVASKTDNGVQIIDISDPTNIVVKDAKTDNANGFTMLDGAYDVETFKIGSSTYAIVASSDDDGVQIIDISNPAAIVAKDAETDGANGFTVLNGAQDVDTFTIGSSTYAIVVGWSDDGVQIIDISDPTNIVAKDAETDGVNGFTELYGATAVDAFKCGSRTFAMVTSYNDGGVQVIDISNPKNIVATDAETDGANGFTVLSGADYVDVFTISGSGTYAIVTDYDEKGVQMIKLTGKVCF
jgi:hypothetical protein